MEGDVSLDIGYRYVEMGETVGGGTFSGSPAVTSNRGTKVDNLFAHELYLGLRVGF